MTEKITKTNEFIDKLKQINDDNEFKFFDRLLKNIEKKFKYDPLIVLSNSNLFNYQKDETKEVNCICGRHKLYHVFTLSYKNKSNEESNYILGSSCIESIKEITNIKNDLDLYFNEEQIKIIGQLKLLHEQYKKIVKKDCKNKHCCRKVNIKTNSSKKEVYKKYCRKCITIIDDKEYIPCEKYGCDNIVKYGLTKKCYDCQLNDKGKKECKQFKCTCLIDINKNYDYCFNHKDKNKNYELCENYIFCGNVIYNKKYKKCYKCFSSR